MNNLPKYDVTIIGGGLAGLALSILLAKDGFEVVVVEKETYPFHRVCGEYISLENWNFLESIGYPLSDMDLPVIKNLIVSAPGGNLIKQSLPLGGFGISRYKIDSELAQLAASNGVTMFENTRVNDVLYEGDEFIVASTGLSIKSKIVVGSFGKRSNLDIKWKRNFAERKPNKLNNYIGVKYHIKTDFPSDTIALHNFSNGYCGLSQVEDGKYCLCYLTTAENLQKANNNIHTLERTSLYQNPFLKSIFKESEFLWKDPLTIAQISFDKKSQVENHVLLIGDAAGMITPLCGNGMSMALHGSKIAAPLISSYLKRTLSRNQLEQQFVHQWNILFRKRLLTGRLIQKLFGKPLVTNMFIRSVKPFRKFVSYLIRQTHGEPF